MTTGDNVTPGAKDQKPLAGATARGRQKKRRKKQGRDEILIKENEHLSLPRLENKTYLQHPGTGTHFRKIKIKSSSVLKELNKYQVRICGLCGAKHAPGEPHRTRNAATFNFKSGFSRAPKIPQRTPLEMQILAQESRRS